MTRKVNLLLVEDNDDHAELVTLILREAEIADTIARVADGDQALFYLRREGEYADVGKPDVILLDLKLTRMDGLEVLEDIKNDDQLKMIPVIVLTTSKSEKDQMAAYQRHANGYLVKPTDFGHFGDLVRDFGAFWGNWNEYASPPTPLGP